MGKSASLFQKWVGKAYQWATELLYHPFAWAYEWVAWVVSFGNWGQWRRDALDYLQTGSVLEVGFGTGELLITMVELDFDVIGMEFSPEMHRVTWRKLKRRGVNAKRVRARTEAIPLPSGSFNNIISTFPSNYIAREETLGEIFRVLDDGGKAIVVGLGVHFKSSLRRWLTGWFLEDKRGLMIRFLSHEAEKVGFKTEILTHDTATYALPILILERNNAD
jgi:ubiquinone/menaquinone biosynthesis C-methylase UbiE